MVLQKNTLYVTYIQVVLTGDDDDDDDDTDDDADDDDDDDHLATLPVPSSGIPPLLGPQMYQESPQLHGGDPKDSRPLRHMNEKK